MCWLSCWIRDFENPKLKHWLGGCKNKNKAYRERMNRLLVKSDAISPAVCSRVEHNAIWERVGLARCDGRDMIFISVDDGQDFQGCFLQHVFHRLSHFGAFCAESVKIATVTISSNRGRTTSTYPTQSEELQ